MEPYILYIGETINLIYPILYIGYIDIKSDNPCVCQYFMWQLLYVAIYSIFVRQYFLYRGEFYLGVDYNK